MAGLGAREMDAYALDAEPRAAASRAVCGGLAGGDFAGVDAEASCGTLGAEVARNMREFHHSMKRRCFAHDYKSRSIYMVTLEVKGRQLLLGRICPEKLKRLVCGRLSEEEVIALNQGLFEPSEIGRLVCIRERVPSRWYRAAQLLPLGGVNPRRIADPVKRFRLRELLVDECDGVTPGREHARGVLRRGRSRVKDVRRNEVDSLPENRVYCFRCFRWVCFHNPVGYRKSPPDATLNFHTFANEVSEWDANANNFN